jgi:hypothetical protein
MSSERRLRLGTIMGLAAVTALAFSLVVTTGAPASAQGKPAKQTLQELADDPVACPDGSYLRLDPAGTGNWECLSARDLIVDLALPDVFAVAYINSDGTNGVNPFADTAIAMLVDTNGDGQPGLGDHLITRTVPTDFLGNRRAFVTTVRVVTAISDWDRTQLSGWAGPVSFGFFDLAEPREEFSLGSQGDQALLLVEGDLEDAIRYNSSNLPGEPDRVVIDLRVDGETAAGDNVFLNVDVLFVP